MKEQKQKKLCFFFTENGRRLPIFYINDKDIIFLVS